MTEHDHAVHTDDWDERYSSSDRIWSGRPNEALVAEAASLTLGRALDVGCGEGADAIWLAQHGWKVTALDVSRVALDRAAEAADHAGVDVEWVHSGFLEADLPRRAFDLVSAQYAALMKKPDHEVERALMAAVAPGGTLLVVHHAGMDAEHAREHGHDIEDYVWPADVRLALDDAWDVLVDEQRERDVPLRGGGTTSHTHDLVLRARRR